MSDEAKVFELNCKKQGRIIVNLPDVKRVQLFNSDGYKVIQLILPPDAPDNAVIVQIAQDSQGRDLLACQKIQYPFCRTVSLVDDSVKQLEF